MKLRDTICIYIVKWVGNNQQRFDELFPLFLKDEYRVVQRAARPISELVSLYPMLIKKHLGKLLKYVNQPGLHEAVKRNTVRIMCFDYITSPTEKVAVKAFSLTILENLSKLYPDIKQELKTVIQDRWDYETAAFHSRAKKILKKL